MTYREKIAELRPDCISEIYTGGVDSCPGDYFNGAPSYACGICVVNDANCRSCWDQEVPEEKEPTSFQEDMMEVLGDMTKAQAKFAIEWLWNKYFKEED